jgi:hypothetical protein
VRNDQPVEVTEETRGIAEHKRGLTVEQVLREGVVGHELGHEQALVAIAAVADQVRQPRVPQPTDPFGLLLQPNQLPVNPISSRGLEFHETTKPQELAVAYRELLGVGPGELGELLHRDGRASGALQLAPIDEVGGLLPALGDDVLGREPASRRAELRERELRERRDIAAAAAVGASRRRGLVRIEREGRPGQGRRRRLLHAGPRLRPCCPRPQRGATATHQV